MRIDLILLVVAYMLSQFYRAFLAVVSEALERDIGATAQDLALASGLWFITFAAMQIPIGWALDRIGPRVTSAVLLMIGGAGGSVVFAMAGTPMHINIAMMLIGIGCAPVLMASYYIIAKTYSPRMFATLAAVIVGVGSLGNLASSLPMAMVSEAYGWRAALIGLAVVSALTAVGLWFVVQDPPRPKGKLQGSLMDLLRMPAMWLILPLMGVQYAPAGGLRGLWIGPYFTDVFGANGASIGQVTLLMAVAMIVGSFAYGPLDRILGTRKWVIFWGNVVVTGACFALYFIGSSGFWLAVSLFVLVGLMGTTYPILMAHGRSFLPDHLVGRGVTLLNLFSVGGAGVFQVATGRLFRVTSGEGVPVDVPYNAIFLLFGIAMIVGLIPYLFSRDSLD
ncbi:MAG: MFS transporter [Rhodobacterales bacterium]|nr:MFS transporter [Rhodobacterales bacterium]